MEALVSVIIPTHNRANLLPRAICSVLRQTHRNLECLVVDDASVDNTRSVVQQFSDKRLVYLRHGANKHVSAARNTGIVHARGELIAFLDDDDEWLPTKLERQVSLIQSLPAEVGMVYCWMDYYEEEKVIAKRHPRLRGDIFKYVIDQQPIGNASTLLVRRSAIQQVGGFDEELPRGNDGDFIRRLCLEYEVDFVPEVLVKYHVGHDHCRITRFDEQGIRNAINGHKVKLTRFKNELELYPEQTASILAMVGYHYSEIGEWRNALAYYWRAAATRPFSKRTYVSFLRALRARIARWIA